MIPKWAYVGIAVMATLIIGFRTRIIQGLPNAIRRIYYNIRELEHGTEYIPRMGQGLWHGWVELMRPFAMITADALDLIINFILAPFRLGHKSELERAPFWAPLFSIAAVIGMIMSFLGFYFKYIKGNKPKAYYKDDYSPKPRY